MHNCGKKRMSMKEFNLFILKKFTAIGDLSVQK